jgi:hypothetical protein
MHVYSSCYFKDGKTSVIEKHRHQQSCNTLKELPIKMLQEKLTKIFSKKNLMKNLNFF